MTDVRGSSAAGPLRLLGFSQLAGRYDAFLLDQYGVLHDGQAPYVGVVACLEALATRGKRAVVISNSAKPANYNQRRLADLGIPAQFLAGVVSSGEAFRSSLATDKVREQLGRRCWIIAGDQDRSLLAGLGLEPVGSVAEADFVLVLGLAPPPASVAALEPALRAARDRALPLACANPDLLRVSASGVEDAPGAIAARYAAMGGTVLWFGKPYPTIYRSALSLLGEPPRSRVLAVGDSLDHDIKGAQGAGIDSVLISRGILAPQIECAGDGVVDLDRLRALASAAGAWPTYVISQFVW